MSLPEMAYRFRETMKKKVDRHSKMNFVPTGKIKAYPESILYLPENIENIEIGEYSIFGNMLEYTKDINWHLDIMNQKEFPRDFSFSIDTRSGKNGNVKVVWEINRLQFLTDLCLRFHQTQDQKYLNHFMRILESWKAQNPYLTGVNWYSNIEVNIRILNWFVCWEILQVNKLITQNNEFKKFVETVWLPLIELHGIHADRYESKYSSSNNHLIAEACGLFVAGSYWSFKNSDKWVKKGQQLLEIEIKKQHSENGINKEEASEYIQFITDFFLVAFLVGERNEHHFGSSYKTTLEKIFDYISQLMNISGNVPYYGDDDDGKVFSLETKDQDNFQSLLVSAAILFENASFKRKENSFDLKNTILFGEKGRALYNGLQNSKVFAETRLYENEGHFLVKKGTDKEEIYLHIDVAPLGYLTIAAHGHADALSFFLQIDGKPFIIDPGTYTYHSYPDWRGYFKGTLAHNTIRIDKLDQSTNGGPCLWLDHYSVKLLEVHENSEQLYIKGTHNGYQKIGVVHTRNYFFDKRNDKIIIQDEIEVQDNATHFYEIPLHLHPNVEYTQPSANTFLLSHSDKRNVEIALDNKVKTEVIKGAENPILGWYSASFLQKEPTAVIYSTLESKGSFELKTEIYIR